MSTGEKIRFCLLIIFFGVVFTSLFTWPLVFELGSFYKDHGDWVGGSVELWYHLDSLLSGRIFNQREYFNGYMAYPWPMTLAYSDLFFLPTFIFAPFFLATGNLGFSANMTAFLAYFLSFFSAFWVIYYLLTRGKKVGGLEESSESSRLRKFLSLQVLASIIGALVYAFNPLVNSRFPMHFDLLHRYFLPPIFLFFFLYLERPSLKRAFWFCLFFTLGALTTNYFFIISLTLVPILALPFLAGSLMRQDWNHLTNLVKYSLIGVIFLPVLFYFFSPFLEFSKKEGVNWSLAQNSYFSARLVDYFLSTPDNFLYGSLVKWFEPSRNPKDASGVFSDYQEHTLFLNLAPMALFLLFCFNFLEYLKRNRSHQVGERQAKKITTFFSYLVWYYLLILIISFILSFGPFFYGWNGKEGLFPLPYYFLFQLLPFFRGMRVPSRMEFFFYVAFSFFAAWGALLFLQKFKKKYLLATSLLVFFIFLENFNYKNLQQRSAILPKVKRLNAKGELSFLKGKGTIHFPINIPEDFGKEAAYQNWLTETGEKIVNTNTSYLPADQIKFVTDIKNRLDKKALMRLKAISVDYVIIHRDLLGGRYRQYFAKYESLYRRGLVFDREQVMIISLDKYRFKITACRFPDDFNLNFALGATEDFSRKFNVVAVKNTKNCYLASTFDGRYQKLPVIVNGKPSWVNLRLPILIGPEEEVVLSEINREVKFE